MKQLEDDEETNKKCFLKYNSFCVNIMEVKSFISLSVLLLY